MFVVQTVIPVLPVQLQGFIIVRIDQVVKAAVSAIEKQLILLIGNLLK